MKISNFKYYVSQASKSVARNGLMSLTSIFIVVCCLFIMGLFLVISINVNYIADQVQDQCEIQVFLDETASAQQVEAAGDKIRQIDNVSAAQLFTKQEALDYMRDLFGENASALDGLEDDNPFRDSYKITLTDLAKAQETANALEQVNMVAEVQNNQELMNSILDVTTTTKYVSFWIMLLLSVVSVFIIANTIKLAVFARRREINVMKFVGATNWFIRWPFVFEGIIIGLIGGVIAFGFISWGYIAALQGISLQMDMFQLKSYADIWWVLLGSFAIIGMLIGAIGSAFSIRKHLDV